MQVSRARERLSCVEAGRAAAAILVVFYHCNKFYFNNPAFFADCAFWNFFESGHSGVEFFFVLSGFLIAMVHWRDIGKWRTLLPYVKKRLLRIYPFFWLTMIVVISLAGFSNHLGARLESVWTTIGSFLLIGIDPFTATIYVSWTLFHEILFYILFGLAILSRRLGWAVFLTWFSLCCLSDLVRLGSIYPFAFMNVLFSFGVLAFKLSSSLTNSQAVFSAAIGAVLFLLAAFDDVYLHALPRDLQIACYGFGSALIVGGLTELEKRGLCRAPWILQLCGQASYSIYLTHSYVLAPLAKLLSIARVPSWLPPNVGLVFLGMSATAIGIAIHRFIERPLISKCRRLLY